MTSRQSRRLVQKEKLSPASAAHDRSATPFELAEADDPGPGRPATFEQGPVGRVVNDAAIASEKATRCNSDNLAKWRHSIL
ncbi:hypothetical protein [Ferrovibrio sp.]|uniref:hypothetical protein n=1 Tax=Ferrovibrio sp. TaxID=1917215 RepID=UPI0025BE305A|nr:hypothetical protein [Ferrovibrio sp.]